MFGFVVAGALVLAANGRPSVITSPDWAAAPDAAAITRAYPSLAADLGIEGYGTISCQITLEGRAADCEVLGESPAHWGFGAAAVKAAESFRFKPKTLDGAPVAGGTVRIPLHFKLPPETADPSADDKPVVSASRLGLARQVLSLRGSPDDLTAVMQAALRNTPPPTNEPTLRAALEQASLEAAAVLGPKIWESTARELAREYSETQLKNALALAAQPGGLPKALATIRLKNKRATDAYRRPMALAVRTAVCAKLDCEARPPVIAPRPATP